MGLIFTTSTWLDRLWSEHLQMSSPARDLVEAGIKKQGELFAGFPADLHARLYLPSDPRQQAGDPEWATRLHQLASELGEWQRLRGMCARNGFAAGIATESMLAQLLPLVPDPPSPPPAGEGGAGQGSSSPNPSTQSNQPSDAALRAALRKATRQARDAVQEAEAELEGMSTPLGFPMPGTSVTPSTGPANMKAIRDAHSRIRNSRQGPLPGQAWRGRGPRHRPRRRPLPSPAQRAGVPATSPSPTRPDVPPRPASCSDLRHEGEGADGPRSRRRAAR